MHTSELANDLQNRVNIYCGLMEEVKIRIGIVEHMMNNDSGLPLAMVREICYLQFRMVCEVIAVACLTAHGDASEAEVLKKIYEPGKILKGLERLHPHFYPQPIEVTTIDGVKEFRGLPDAKILEKQQIPRLYGIAGDILHRGKWVNLYDPAKHPQGDNSDIADWLARIAMLLKSHWITLIENNKAMWVSLAPAGEKTHVSILTISPEDKTISVATTKVA